MKLLAFIMAFIILAISIVPCADEESIATAGMNAISEQHTGDPHEDHADKCSPLCTCSCCAGFAFIGAASKVAVQLLVPARQYSPLTVSPTFTIHSAIWQPPRFV